MTFKGWYNGHMETCLVHGSGTGKKGDDKGKPICKYPVTEHGSLSCKRVRAAIRYAGRFGDTEKVKRGGWFKYAHKCGIKHHH